MAGGDAQANTNLSTLLSITFLDENSNEIPVHTSADQAIELLIPRDVNTVVPPMILQNVSIVSTNSSINNRQFNLHFINITQSNTNISVSVHFEMRSFNLSLGYMMIYKFDGIPQLNSLINQIDGWSLMCPSSKWCLNIFLSDNDFVQ
jgi:hypothetical protein